MVKLENKADNDVVDKVGHEVWGQIPNDNFGYASDEERRAKRGLEDWELVEKIPLSQKAVPKWFFAVVVAVLLVAIGLSFPFWGDRAGYERVWVDWGFGVAILYLLVFGGFVYFMVDKYSPSVDGNEEMGIPEIKATPPNHSGTKNNRNNQ
ncbi:MAG: hypothetical protein GXP08_14820 [Gammaproteobacteria bacterium]|nr:hypothetical protein [Gammaproteobacteria bacterium]